MTGPIALVRCLLAIYALGLWGHYGLSGTPIATDIGRTLGWSLQIDSAVLKAVCCAAWITACMPLERFGVWGRRCIIAGSCVISTWQLSNTIAHAYGIDGIGLIAIGEHATRYVLAALPAVIAFNWQPSEGCSRDTFRKFANVAMLATAATFIAHGLKAWMHKPAFVDLITQSAVRCISLRIPEQTAQSMLSVIGAIDVLVAFLLLSPVRIWALRYMYVWGTVAAFSRVTAMRVADAWDEPLIRIANGGLPLVVALILLELHSVSQAPAITEENP